MKRFPKSYYAAQRPSSGQVGKLGFSLSDLMHRPIELMFLLIAAHGHRAWAKEEDHLLTPERESDAPLPLYKSFWEIIQENSSLLLAIGGASLLLTLALWLMRRLRKGIDGEEKVPVRDPYEEAIEALEILDAESNKMEAKPFTFRLSEVLRVYVQRQFELPAMELTGEEFLREATEHKFFRNYYDDLLREFIDRSEVVKYSRESMDGEGMQLLLHSATHFVKDSNRRLEETEDEKPSISKANGT